MHLVRSFVQFLITVKKVLNLERRILVSDILFEEADTHSTLLK
jgi:hypothetical protein